MTSTPYLTASEVRTRVPQLANTTNFTSDELNRLVAEFEDIAERYRGVAFTPRSISDTWTQPDWKVQLTHWPVRSITSVVYDTTTSDLTKIMFDKNTARVWGDDWTRSKALTITYSHGLDAPSPQLLRATAEYVRACALADRSGNSRDVISQSFDGGVTRFSTPSWEMGRPTGYLEVDRILNSLPDYRLMSAG
jgi:hypothetical protein